MSRQINLFNPALIRRRDHLNANLLLGLSVGVLLLILVFFAYTRHQLAALIQQHEQVSAQLKANQMMLVQATQEFMPRQPSLALQKVTAQAESRLDRRREMLSYLQQDKFGSHEGFSSYMRAFARKSINALWLTGFSIDHDSNEVTLHGRALQPELVSQYIGQLGMDPVLRGRTFTAFTLSVPKTATARSDGADAATAAKSDRTNAAVTAPPEPFIEFELKSSSLPEGKPQADAKKS